MLKVKSKVAPSKPSTPERSSLASLFDAADASNASNKLSEGQHEVRLNEIKLVEDKAKGTYASATFEAIDGDEEGKKASSRYTLIDAQGEPSAGLDILKRDLALLGYEDVKGSKLKKVLEEITEEQPMCIVNVKLNGQYANVYLQGVSEGGVPNTEDDGDKEDGKEAEAEVVLGSKVSFTHAKEGELEGEVIKITDDTAIVLVDKKKYKVAGEDLTLVADEAEEEPAEEEEEPEKESFDEIEVGSRVEWDDDDMGHVEGEVKKIKKGIATVEDDDGDNHQVSVDDLTIA